MDKPIPAFYCCYLLRSTVRHACLYVGSTPNPARRLNQHNGKTKGGAKSTSKNPALRPWEMTCIVTGFPSKVAALQFEWAWQNTHITRHAKKEREERANKSSTTTGTSPPDKTKTRQKRPSYSLEARLSNLHLLLRVRSFERWPLKVTIFAADVFKIWEGVNKSAKGRIRQGIKIYPPPEGARQASTSIEQHSMPAPTGITAIDVGYSDVKSHLEKSRSIFEKSTAVSCGICETHITPATSLVLACPTEDCRSASHLTCLSRVFLAENGDADAIVPTEGSCPNCHTKLEWSTLLRELSLRTRGEKDVEALFKMRRNKRTHLANAAKDHSSTAATIAEIDDEDDTELENNEVGEPSDDGWIFYEDEAPDDIIPYGDLRKEGQRFASDTRGRHNEWSCSRLDIVIEDSDADGADVWD
ncbi:GIY-YIG-domain-containing protein [Lepidopterella palustris CBS 459.81]|uniref:GIY-YIG-domain-containing protein n=1 Tax=Lepidopterella palustris CBS 459.81 TaxID=1314670 RepID=A0A8E2EDT0_9PEZI|nr:GIY-YIG-domain-containing protein [Lepidopterella palustris CBS 459.81]